MEMQIAQYQDEWLEYLDNSWIRYEIEEKRFSREATFFVVYENHGSSILLSKQKVLALAVYGQLIMD